ncbi:MAG: hypothetical protein ACI9SP_000881 [Arenicella sp.]|jgi:hypothetical protein
MDKRYIEENEIEIKYLRNQLNPEELEEFEVYLMENPEMVESLRLSQLMIDTNLNSIKTDEKAIYGFLGLIFSNTGLRLIGSYSLGVLTAGVLTIFFANNWSGTHAQPFTQIAYLSQTRALVESDDSIPVFEFAQQSFNASSQDKIVLSLDLGLMGEGEFGLVIRGPYNRKNEAEILESIDRIKSDSLGNITLVMPVKLFEPSVYEIEIEGDSFEEEMFYKFKLEVKTE